MELHEQIKTTTAVSSKPHQLNYILYCTVCPTGLQAVIPLLKEHMAGSCSAELLLQIRQLVVGLTLSQMKQEVGIQYESKKHWTEVTYSNFEEGYRKVTFTL